MGDLPTLRLLSHFSVTFALKLLDSATQHGMEREPLLARLKRDHETGRWSDKRLVDASLAERW